MKVIKNKIEEILEEVHISESSPKEVGDHIKRITGIDIFKNTRKREYVEYRALVCFLLKQKLGMRWTYIANYFKTEGKDMHHATIIHLVKNYPMYKRYNENLEKIEKMFTFKSSLCYDAIDNMHYLQNKCDSLEKKQAIIKNKMKLPLARLLADIPLNRFEEVTEQIKVLKESWKKNKK
jgi:hypothetical protein